MKRPFIFCHMATSVDGKIWGNFMDTPEFGVSGTIFDDISMRNKGGYNMEGWLSGRVTTDKNFTFFKEPKLDENAPLVPAGDFVPQTGKDRYYISIDPSGKLGWEKNYIEYEGIAYVIEVITEKASNSYKDLLRRLNIPYIIAGKEALDAKLALEKLHTLFGFKSIMLGGGGVLNWTFIQEGLCDEVSLVVAPVADGSSEQPSSFETGKLGNDTPVSFTLKSADILDGSTLWLRYTVNNSDHGCDD